MRHDAQRGFTLLETVVAVGVVAMLAGIVFWTFAIRPAAASQAADDFDVAFAAARAIAQTNPNGATLAFLPRSAGRSGFVVRVYAGRPNGESAVADDNVMPVDASASVTEATLGKPPFALFLGASDHVSGLGRYPHGGGADAVVFTTIADEPPCPKNGFTLAFSSPGRAATMRHIACTVWIATAPLPNPSPTPNVPIVEPTTLTYHWPADREQRFDATEWGYTHWFAAANGFRCGDGVATFPDVLPSPYSPPYDEREGSASPSPPAQTPYSYPNSHGQSMNDAPAPFPLAPLSAGVCRAAVSDDNGQSAAPDVDVMGWLTVSFGGRSYARDTNPPLQFPRSALDHRGSRVALALMKTFDAQPLQPQVWLTPACAPYLQFEAQPDRTPSEPSKQPATATATLQLIALPSTPLTCAGTFFDQYPGSRDGEGVSFGAVVGDATPPQAWPAAVEFATRGGSLLEGARCEARPYTDARFDDVDVPPQWLNGLVALDRNGCYDGSVWIREPQSSPGSFDVLSAQSSCLQAGWLVREGWISGNQRPGPDGLALSAGDRAQPRDATCTIALRGDVDAPGNGVVQIVGRVVGSCPQKGDAWLGPADGVCYDLYDDVTATTENGGWIEESNVGIYVPHGTTGDELYQWIVGNGSCYIQPLAGTAFADWTTVLGNGDPTPPPAPSPSPVANPAGFGIDFIPRAAALTSAPSPRPTQPPPQDCR